MSLWLWPLLSENIVWLLEGFDGVLRYYDMIIIGNDDYPTNSDVVFVDLMDDLHCLSS